jgi:predicted nuclease of restriction endonuclease-like RecB superfamily
VLAPSYLSAKDRPRLLPLVQALLATFQGTVGEPKATLDEAVLAIEHGPRDRLVFLGLKKLCEDRLALTEGSDLVPADVRAVVFALAADAHRSSAGFDRGVVLEQAAARLGLDPLRIDGALFADLREAQIVSAFDPVEPDALLDSYNLSVAQAILLRATRLVVSSPAPAPRPPASALRAGASSSQPPHSPPASGAERWRTVFRSLRFHGLLHRVERSDRQTTVIIDGPFSLFDSVQRYGLRMGLFLRTALKLEDATITAEVLWGKERTPARYDVTSSKDLLASVRGLAEPELGPRPELDVLVEAFSALGSAWAVERCEELFVARDGAVVAPDLVFRKAGVVPVYLELFGFWSRAAVFTRVAQLEQGGLPKLVLLAGKNLRVSEEVVDEESVGASLYIFKTTISAREVHRRLEQLVESR